MVTSRYFRISNTNCTVIIRKMSQAYSQDVPIDMEAIASNLAHYVLIQERTQFGVKRADIVEKILQVIRNLWEDHECNANNKTRK